MAIISCSVKLWSFSLAEQLEANQLLDGFYTTYAYNKNTIARLFRGRIDKEIIPIHKIHTCIPLAFPAKLYPSKAHTWNDLFDKWVSRKLAKQESRIFIGWSGMSLHSIRAAHKCRMVTILERGSSHISVQDRILRDEYKRSGIDFSIDPATIKKELREYEESDYIMVPSDFVKRTFLEQGVDAAKVRVNPFGASAFFRPGNPKDPDDKFIIVYLGTLSIRKGLVYLFEALSLLSIPADKYEVWFIGSVENHLQQFIDRFKQDNWKFYGHVNHYQLQHYLERCDVGVQPSLEEGLSMVIPQMMSCGIPVIVTPNTGAENIMSDKINGFLIPPREPAVITEKIQTLFYDKPLLDKMKKAASAVIAAGFTWKDYGNRYADFLKSAGEQTE